MESRPLISFDWAIKKLLRQKANYDVLEGFLTVLLRRDIKIMNIPESEGNSEEADDKINKVDILCENEHKELILIELQYNSENDYFQRMLFGSSKIITNYMSEGYTYDKVRKVYSINIVYFDLGQGNDYVYHGTTVFRGIHTNDTLQVNVRQKEVFGITAAYQIYPEYYIIKVNKFDDVSKDSLDEWIYYFKNNRLPENYSAPGLDKVAELLNYNSMDANAKAQYEAHQKELAISYGVLETAKAEGKAEGRAEGEEKKTISVVVNSFRLGHDIPTIAIVAGISKQEVINILKEQGMMS